MLKYEILLDRFEECDGNVTSSECKSTVEDLTSYVNEGGLDGAGLLAEIQAIYEPYLDQEQAYINYYVNYALEGYSVKFDNQEDDPVNYYGADGDFRNESMVSELVDAIGIPKVKKLDSMAMNILDQHEPKWRELEEIK